MPPSSVPHFLRQWLSNPRTHLHRENRHARTSPCSVPDSGDCRRDTRSTPSHSPPIRPATRRRPRVRRPVAQHRRDLLRRPGLRRPGLLRLEDQQDAATWTAWPPRACGSPVFYVAQAVCSASRTALLTGCYPNRVGHPRRAGARPDHGIHDNEITLAEVAKKRGLRHGHLRQVAPGPPSASSCPRATASTNTSACPTPTTCGRSIPSGKAFPPLPLIEGEQARSRPCPTRRADHHATPSGPCEFIEKNKDRPFLLYLAAHHAPRAAARLRRVRAARRARGSTAT